MKTSLLLIAVFALVMLPAAFAQSTPSQDPSQPSAQQPSSQTPSSQQPDMTQNPSSQSPSAGQATSPTSTDSQKAFVGSIKKDASGKFVLHTGGTDYQLDDQSQAAKFDGKDVKVSGKLDATSNTIQVQSIEPASSM